MLNSDFHQNVQHGWRCMFFCTVTVGYTFCAYLLAYYWNIKYMHTPNQFPFMYSQKRLSQESLLIWTKYLQNRIIMFCQELLNSVEKYCTIQDAAIQLSAKGTTYFYMELWNYTYSSTGYLIFQIRNTKMAPWICYFLIWRYLGFGIEVWLIPFGIMLYKSGLYRWIFPIWEFKIFCENIYSWLLITYFKWTVVV